MNIYENKEYLQSLDTICQEKIAWDKLANTTICISGATGLIGSCLIDLLWRKNRAGLNCRIIAIGRNEERAAQRFKYCYADNAFRFIQADISSDTFDTSITGVDYVLHLASNTHPLQYANEPVQTIMTNIMGTDTMLRVAKHNNSRFLFASSNEIYGENRGDVEVFDETYCGYIDCNTLRAGYPESKRCGEALCQAYIRQHGVDAVILRLTRSYGPTMLMNDSKALSQFLKNGLNKEDIVLKSAGTQYYSYIYVLDAVTALLTVLLDGVTGEAYNVADEASDIRLRDLATLIAGIAGTKVVYERADSTEAAGYSKATKARLDATKLRSLGWRATYDIEHGIKNTLDMLRHLARG